MSLESDPLLLESSRRWKLRKAPEMSVKLTFKGNPSRSIPSIRFNCLFLKHFWMVLCVAVPGVCSKSLLLLIFLILARAAEEFNYYQMGILPSFFYSALISKDLEAFKEILWKMCIFVVSVCICKSGGEFAAGLVYVRWRSVITQHLHTKYFSHDVYYMLNVTDCRVDNPDQRITQDVDRFCSEVSQALPKLVLQPFLIAYYSYRTYISLGWFGVLAVYGLFVVSTTLNKFIMGPLVSYVFMQEKREGDFRFHHVQVRSNAESLAFYWGGDTEGKKTNQRLKLLLRTQLSSVHWQLPLNFAVFLFDYVSTIISYSLVGVAIFMGRYDHLTPGQLASVVSQNTFFSMYLLNSFSTVVDTAVKFAEIGGYTHRIGQLLLVLKDVEKKHLAENRERRTAEQQEHGENTLRLGEEGEGNVALSNAANSSINRLPSRLLLPPQCVEVAAVLDRVTIAPPRELVPLVEGLSLEFRKGQNIIIVGETGMGKTSIFRVLRELWTPLSGRACLCVELSHRYVMFIPQRPHLTSGTLADQVVFPETVRVAGSLEANTAEDKINECLAITGLVSLRDRLGGAYVPVCENWYDVTSPGEAQRIAFARLFYHMPPFAFLDEVTSALSEESEDILYSKMLHLGITFMSIGQRSTLMKFHHQVLHINQDHSWSLKGIAMGDN